MQRSTFLIGASSVLALEFRGNCGLADRPRAAVIWGVLHSRRRSFFPIRLHRKWVEECVGAASAPDIKKMELSSLWAGLMTGWNSKAFRWSWERLRPLWRITRAC